MKNILLIQLRQLGDILLTTPCIREIKTQNPDIKITFLSHKMGRLVLEGCPYVDNLILYDDELDWISQIKFVLNLKKLNFDCVIDFMNNPRSAIYSFVANSSKKISFQTKRSFVYTHTLPKSKTPKYIVLEKFELLKHAGFNPKNIDLILPWNEKDSQKILEYLNQIPQFNSSSIRVVLSPTHRRAQRMWNLKNYALLADFLVKNYNAFVIWLWGPGEENIVDKCILYCKEKTFKAPFTTFREMAALIANHDIFIGNSNGPSHVAVATKILSIQLHGPTKGVCWCPPVSMHQYIQSSSTDINDIKIQDVIKKFESMYSLVSTHSQIRKHLPVRQSFIAIPYSEYILT